MKKRIIKRIEQEGLYAPEVAIKELKRQVDTVRTEGKTTSLWSYLKDFLLGVVLFVIAFALYAVLALWGIIELIIEVFVGKRFWKALSRFGDFFKIIAVILDILGNVTMQIPFNRILIKRAGYQFGSRYDTISYVLGINELDHTLSKTGKFLVKVLNWFENDHCYKTVEYKHLKFSR